MPANVFVHGGCHKQMKHVRHLAGAICRGAAASEPKLEQYHSGLQRSQNYADYRDDIPGCVIE